MREIIPSLPIVYAVASILLLMLVTACISLYFNLRNEVASHGILFWLKLILSVPLLLLGAGLTAYIASVFGVFFLIGGSTSLDLKLLLLTLTPVVVYIIAVWVLVRWIRNKRYANVSVIIGIIISVSIILVFQRAWICKPLVKIGIGSAQKCVTQHDLELQDIERERQQKLLDK